MHISTKHALQEKKRTLEHQGQKFQSSQTMVIFYFAGFLVTAIKIIWNHTCNSTVYYITLTSSVTSFCCTGRAAVGTHQKMHLQLFAACHMTVSSRKIHGECHWRVTATPSQLSPVVMGTYWDGRGPSMTESPGLPTWKRKYRKEPRST